MSADQEFTDLMQSIAKKSMELLAISQRKPIPNEEVVSFFLDFSRDFHNLLTTLLMSPEKIWETQVAYWQDAMGLYQDQVAYWLKGEVMPSKDKRFSSDEWVNNPFFNLLSQHYLIATEHLNCLIEQLNYQDKRLGKRLQFFTRQYLDALSPANFLQTNPQLMAETIQSHGKNLLRGLQNLLTDMEGGPSRLIIKMTDMDAFKIGKNIAITPGKVIFRNDLMELIQYTPTTATVHEVPLLIIPPWINKYYILDLSAHNSFVRWLVQQGITVFMISWINPDQRHAQKGLFEYLQEGPLTAIEIIQKQLQVPKVNTLGFCIGGTLQACLLAYYKAHGIETIQCASFLASMIDFSDPGDIIIFIDEHQISQLEEKMQLKGYLEGRFMMNTFNSLRANDLVWSFFIKNYLQGKNPVPFDILYWNADATNMPATMHSQYLRWMYLHNDLIVPNKVHLNHTPLDVSQIDIPTFFVSTQKDHIAPWKTTYNGFLKMKGEKRFLLGGSGHIAGIINPPDNQKYDYFYSKNTYAKADEWLANATQYKGSWWPQWFKWLEKKSGPQIPAPKWQELPLPGLQKAPGRYVRMSSTEKPKA